MYFSKTIHRKHGSNFWNNKLNLNKKPIVEGSLKLVRNMSEQKVDSIIYRKMVGKLIYLVNIGPNIIF